jgi:hypothetical protein
MAIPAPMLDRHIEALAREQRGIAQEGRGSAADAIMQNRLRR